jgi:hypothetical protein
MTHCKHSEDVAGDRLTAPLHLALDATFRLKLRKDTRGLDQGAIVTRSILPATGDLRSGERCVYQSPQWLQCSDDVSILVTDIPWLSSLSPEQGVRLVALYHRALTDPRVLSL